MRPNFLAWSEAFGHRSETRAGLHESGRRRHLRGLRGGRIGDPDRPLDLPYYVLRFLHSFPSLGATLRHVSPTRPALDDTVIRICCTGAVLALLLVVLRTRILFGWSDLRAPSRVVQGVVRGAYGDVAYASGLTGAFVLVRLLTRKVPWSAWLTVGLFGIVVSLSLLLGFVNVRAIAELGHPVNYQWLYYSNFMRSLDSYTALAALLSWSWVIVVAAACLGLLIAAHLLVLATRQVLSAAWGRQAATIVVGALVAYLGLGWFWRHAAGPTSPKEANAVVALVGSVLDADVNPVLARMPTRFGPDDFLTAGDRQARGTQTPYTARGRQAGVRNVIVIVMESVAAEYLWRFGAADSGGTPELDHYQQWARRFTSFYAHQPSTTHSLVSLLLGVHSPHSFRVITREHPDIALPSLSGELKRQGYRTAFISAADNRFQNIDLFLSHQHFDLIADSRAGSCPSGDAIRMTAWSTTCSSGWTKKQESQFSPCCGPTKPTGGILRQKALRQTDRRTPRACGARAISARYGKPIGRSASCCDHSSRGASWIPHSSSLRATTARLSASTVTHSIASCTRKRCAFPSCSSIPGCSTESATRCPAD